MKAERRHELQDNDLAAALQQTRTYLDVHGKQIGMGAIVIVGVLAVVSFVMRSRAAAVEDTWRRRNQLTFTDFETGKKSLDTLAGIMRERSDADFVIAGLIDQGHHALRLSQLAPAPPDKELTQTARAAFQELLTKFGDNPLALGSALAGLASVEENEFVIDHGLSHEKKAKEHLDRIVKEARLNGMPFQKMALDRIRDLDATFSTVMVDPAPPPPPAPPTTETPQPDAVQTP